MLTQLASKDWFKFLEEELLPLWERLEAGALMRCSFDQTVEILIEAAAAYRLTLMSSPLPIMVLLK
jgi:hypothetical protein